MEVAQAERAAPSRGVYVYHGDGDAVRQPGSFQFCPLGVHVYSRNPVPLCELMDFTLELPVETNSPEPITCTCIVANCEMDATLGLYRIWMKFLDLPEAACSRIHELTKTSKYLCPFCANF